MGAIEQARGNVVSGVVDVRGTWILRLRDEAISATPTSIVSIMTAISFIEVFGTWDFFWPMTITALIVHVWGCIVRATNPPAFLAFIAPALAVVLGVGWLRFRDSLWFGLPLSNSWQSISSDLRSAWQMIGDVITPVEFTSGFGTMALFIIGSVAAATDSFASRYGGRVEVFVPAAATLFVVATVGTGQNRVAISTAWFMTAILAAILIRRHRISRTVSAQQLRPAPRAASIRSAVGIAVFVAAIGISASSVAPLLPGAGDEAWLTQRSRASLRELQPLVDIRRQLTEPSPTVLFTVQAEASAYWRVTSLANFDGSTWTISQEQLDSAGGSLTSPPGADDPGVDSVINFQRFTIEALSGNLVPIAATPTRLRSSSQSLFFEAESGTLLMGGNGARLRDSYEMQSTMLSPRPERLIRATSDAPPSDAYLDLPDSDVMDGLRDTAESIASMKLSPYQRALAIQDYFRNAFTYSLDVPAMSDKSYGLDATLEFLERRTGYCEHFASTFSLFARSLGLPTRVVVGFTPGELSRTTTGENLFTVRSSHAHAWPEVWFDGLGWVLFEPTPGRGAPNSSHTNVPEEQNDDPAPSTTVPSTTSTISPSASVAPTTPLGISDSDSTNPDAGTSNDSSGLLLLLIILIALVIIGWIAILPRATLHLVRRRHEASPLVLWRRAIALYELERGVFPLSLSPDELASHATSRLYDDDPLIIELAEIAGRTLFGQHDLTPSEIEDLEERTDTYLAERRSRLMWYHRVRLRLDPIIAWKLAGGSKTGRSSR